MPASQSPEAIPFSPRAGFLIVVGMAVAGRLAIMLAEAPSVASPFWPPDGIALAALLLCGLRAWPAVLAGHLAIQVLVLLDPTVPLTPTPLFATATAVSGTLQAVLGTLMMRRALAEPTELRLEHDVLVFLFVIAPFSGLVDSLVATALVQQLGLQTPGTSLSTWFVWWAGDVIGIAAFTPIALALASPRSELWRGRRLVVAVPLFLAAMTIALLNHQRRASDVEAARADFQKYSTELAQRTSRVLEAHLDALVSLAAVKKELLGISRLEFSAFSRRLLANHAGWRGMDWVIRVPGSARAVAEANAGREAGDQFRIRELLAPDSAPVSPLRPVHYPVLYSEPAERSWRMRGRDYASEPVRRALLEHAAELQHPLASDLHSLALGPGEPPGVLVAQVVSGSGPYDPPEGFVVGVLQPASLLPGLVPAAVAEEMQVALMDATDRNRQRVLYQGRVGVTSPVFTAEMELPVPGRRWVLRTAVGPAFAIARRDWVTPAVLVVGILLITILAGLLLVISGRPALLTRVMEDLSARHLDVERELQARKQAEAELSALERRWSFALEGSGTGVWEQVVPAGRFYFSPQWKALLGFRPDELEDTENAWRSRLHPEDAARATGELERHLRGDTPHYESTYRLQVQGGGWRWFHSRGRVMERDADGAPLLVLGTLNDVNARYEAELALAESEQRFRLLVESIQEVFWMTTAYGERYTYLSPAFDQVWGSSRLEALADPDVWRRSVHPADLPRLLTNTGFRDGTSETEYRIRRPDGQERWIHERVFAVRDGEGRVLAVGGVSTDITRRKRAERDLRASEERFRLLVEHAPDGILIHRHGRIEYANPALVRLVGASAPAEVVGREVTEFLHPDFHEQFRHRVRHMAEGGTVPTIPVAWRRIDGTTVEVEISATAVPLGDEFAIQMMVRDVSQMRLQQALLRENERKYRALVETTDTGYVIFDRDGRVLDANREYLRLTGRSDLGQVIGQPVTAWTRPEDRPRIEETLRRCLAEGSVRHLETDYVSPAGRAVPVELNATVLIGSHGLQVLGLCRDISERRQAQEALADSARFIEQVLDTFPGPIAVRDAEGNFRLVNRVLADELGSTKEALLEGPGPRLHVLASRATDREVLAERVTRVTDEPFRPGDNGTHWYHVIRTPLVRGDGEVLLLQMGLDITARREAEEAYRRLNAELEDRVRERTAELERLNGMLREAEAALSQENHYLEALNQLALALLAREDVEVVLHDLVRSACQLTSVGGGVLCLADAGRTELLGRVQHGDVPAAWREPVGPDDDFLGRVWRSGESALASDGRGAPRAPAGRRPERAAVPLRSGEQVLGVLAVVRPRGVDGETLRILDRFAQLAVLVLDHASLQEALQRELDERRRSEERQRRLAMDLLEAQRIGHVGSWVWDPVADTVECSDEVLRILGVDGTGGRVQLADWLELLHPADFERVHGALAGAAGAPRRFEVEVRAIRPDGHHRHVNIRGESVQGADGAITRLSGIIQDITEEREAQLELAKRASELAAAERIGRVGSLWRELDSETVHCSAECRRLLGLAPHREAVDWRELRAMVGDDDRPALEETLRAALAGAGRGTWEGRAIRADGVERVFQASFELGPHANAGRPQFSAMIRDVTEERAAAERLRRQAWELAEAQRIGRVGTWWLDLASGVTRWSDTTCDIFGVPHGTTVAGEGYLDHVYPEDRPVARELSVRILVEGTGEAEFRALRPDGTVRVVYSVGELRRGPQGTPAEVIGFNRDVTRERAATEALRRKARELAEAQRVGQIGSWSWERDGDEANWSDELYRLYGLEPGGVPITFDGWLERIHPADQEACRAVVARMLEEGERTEWEFRVLHPDGSTHTLHTLGEAQRDATGRVVRLVGISQDITERLAMERALRESEERYRLAIRSTVDGVWDWPDLSQEMVVWSPRCFQLLGYEPGEFPVTASYCRDELLHPADREAALRVARGHLVERSPLELDVRLRTREGTWRWFRLMGEAQRDAAGVPVRVAGSMQDIDDQKRAELELDRSRAMFEVFVEQNPTVSYLKDEEGRLQYVNRAYIQEIWRGAPPEWQGRTDAELWAPELAADYRRNDARVLATGQSEVVEESFYRDGESQTWLNFKFPVTLAGGARYLAGMAVNLTAQKRAEAEIRRLNLELEERVRRRTADLQAANQELESFSYSVSHDLRTPLRAIDGFCQALLEDYAPKLDAAGRGYLERVRLASQRMGTLIDDLLQLSRLTRGEIRLASLDLSTLAGEVLAELRTVEPARDVAVRVQPGLTALGDPALIRVLLANLLQNAWKFTGRRTGAEIEFGTTVTVEGPAYFVRDNGVGFDPQYAGKLFGPFQRLHHRSEFDGSGIGLATVQRIVRRHGGRVWAESRPGEGATFYFTLGTEGRD